jgi:hypothetical protein
MLKHISNTLEVYSTYFTVGEEDDWPRRGAESRGLGQVELLLLQGGGLGAVGGHDGIVPDLKTVRTYFKCVLVKMT